QAAASCARTQRATVMNRLAWLQDSYIGLHRCLPERFELSRTMQSSIEMIPSALAPQRCDADAQRCGGIFERWRQHEHAPDVLLFDLLERRLLGQVSVPRSARLEKDVRQIFF